jgi:hypothetical protein
MSATAEPGELFVLRQMAQFPLEWAVVARDAGDPALLLVVPADTLPETGSADVRLPARATAGPLSLRCGFPVWVPADFLLQGVRSGRLADTDLARARRLLDELEQGRPTGSPLEQQTEDDPEYIDWMVGTVAQAAAALGEARAEWESGRARARALEAPPRYRWSRAAPLAAAAMIVVAVGLSFQTVVLQRRIDRLSQPLFNLPSGEVLFAGPSRGPAVVTVRLPRGTHHLLLTVVVGNNLPAGGGAGRLEIQTPRGRAVWTSPPFQLKPGAELNLVVARELLPERRYRLALYGTGAAAAAPPELHDVELDAEP